uniref:PAP2_C domain-containing protein n=1 Tax=Gongylonema pulchrum TaxID=637853 RepID=A0A183CVF5_9BILA
LANELALAWIHERVPRDGARPLPDLWFSVFPEVRKIFETISNSSELIMVVIVANAFFVMFCHQYRWIVVRRVFFCAALCYTFRAFCITIFQVPVPSEKTFCAPKSDGSLKIVVDRVLRTFWSAGIEQIRSR